MSSTVRLPIDAIRIPEVRASSKLTPEQMEFFKATIDAVGVVQDPVVRPVEPGFYELVAGKTRLEELKARGETEVQVKVIEADERTALFMHLAENLARGSIDFISAAQVIQKAKNLGASIEEISRIMGKSETWTRRTLALNDLPDEVQGWIRDGDLTPTHVYLAAKMPTPNEAMDALQTFKTHGWNTSVAETFVDNRIAQLEAARTSAIEKGVEFAPPPVEAEKLISFKQCLLCGFRVPADKVSVQLVCEGCQELARYITSQLGPWDKAKDVVFSALQIYFGQRDRMRSMSAAPSTEASPERTSSEEPPRTP